MYNNFEYSSINELLDSVKEVGIKFQELYLEINFLLYEEEIEDFEIKF